MYIKCVYLAQAHYCCYFSSFFIDLILFHLLIFSSRFSLKRMFGYSHSQEQREILHIASNFI